MSSPFPGHIPPLSATNGNCDQPRDFDWLAKNIPCQEACPARTDIPGYLAAISKGDFATACLINLRDNIFPGVLGRVCTRPCEAACRHGWDGLGESIAICHAKRSGADYGQTTPEKTTAFEKQHPPTGKRVAIVGAGVAGLACARNLALLGHSITVFERHHQPGGMLVQGIPTFRLPRHIVEQDIAHITALGVEIKCHTTIGKDVTITSLEESYDAVILATGTPTGNIPEDLEGHDTPGIEHGLSFLQNVNAQIRQEVEGPVVVIGGGFTAIDCARSALRLGGTPTRVYYRRAVSAIQVTPGELEEMEQEGLTIEGNVRPIRVITADGAVIGLRMIRTRSLEVTEDNPRGRIEDIPGSEFEIEARTVLLATGQRRDDSLTINDLEIGFEAGDCATGAQNLIAAIGHAKQVAIDVDRQLMQTDRHQQTVCIEDGRTVARAREMDAWPRTEMPTLSPDQRIHQAEVETGYSKADGIIEAKRCYLCHYKYEIDISRCIYCDQCVEVKPRPNCIVKITEVETEADGRIKALSRQVADTDQSHRPFFYYIDQEDCIRCNACLEVCPTRCISVQKVTRVETQNV
jgi:NADPH-dependent glutamate synthase beta subunit-like oxidoreductase/NAD-dependent dihydropyrimidine dehydrogenase PreA subunit